MNPWKDPRVAAGLTRQLAKRRDEVGAGATPIGWKVGFGAPASLDLLRITAPLVGYLTSDTRLEAGASVDVSGWVGGVVEFEVAVRMGEALAAGASDVEASAAVDALAPAIELADVTMKPGPHRVADILAANIFHAGVILGEFDSRRSDIDLDGLMGQMAIDRVSWEPIIELEEMPGRYSRIVATVANTLASQGEMLRAGDIIITGAIVPPVPVGAGSEFSYSLDSAAPITVRCDNSPTAQPLD